MSTKLWACERMTLLFMGDDLHSQWCAKMAEGLACWRAKQ
jgi:hypothetical protein